MLATVGIDAGGGPLVRGAEDVTRFIEEKNLIDYVFSTSIDGLIMTSVERAWILENIDLYKEMDEEEKYELSEMLEDYFEDHFLKDYKKISVGKYHKNVDYNTSTFIEFLRLLLLSESEEVFKPVITSAEHVERILKVLTFLAKKNVIEVRDLQMQTYIYDKLEAIFKSLNGPEREVYAEIHHLLQAILKDNTGRIRFPEAHKERIRKFQEEEKKKLDDAGYIEVEGDSDQSDGEESVEPVVQKKRKIN